MAASPPPPPPSLAPPHSPPHSPPLLSGSPPLKPTDLLLHPSASQAFSIHSPMPPLVDSSGQDLVGLALQCLRSNNAADALEYLQEAEKTNPGNKLVHYYHGVALVCVRRYDESLLAFDEALRIDPLFAAAQLIKGGTLRMMMRHEEAIECLNNAIRLEPEEKNTHLQKGLALSSLNRHEEALASFSEAIRLDSNFSDAILNKGLSLQSLGRYEEALANFNKRISVTPKDILVYSNKGHVLTLLGRLAESAACFDDLIRLEPKEKNNHLQKGLALSSLNRHEEALASFSEAIRLDSNFSEAILNKGLSLQSLGRYEEALANFNKRISLTPKDILVYSNKGHVLTLLGRLAESAACFDDLIRLEPRNKDAHTLKGAALVAQGRYADALPCLQQAIKLDTGHLPARLEKCKALLWLERYESLLFESYELIKFTPSDSTQVMYKALALVGLGRFGVTTSLFQTPALFPRLVQEVEVLRKLTSARISEIDAAAQDIGVSIQEDLQLSPQLDGPTLSLPLATVSRPALFKETLSRWLVSPDCEFLLLANSSVPSIVTTYEECCDLHQQFSTAFHSVVQASKALADIAKPNLELCKMCHNYRKLYTQLTLAMNRASGVGRRSELQEARSEMNALAKQFNAMLQAVMRKYDVSVSPGNADGSIASDTALHRADGRGGGFSGRYDSDSTMLFAPQGSMSSCCTACPTPQASNRIGLVESLNDPSSATDMLDTSPKVSQPSVVAHSGASAVVTVGTLSGKPRAEAPHPSKRQPSSNTRSAPHVDNRMKSPGRPSPDHAHTSAHSPGGTQRSRELASPAAVPSLQAAGCTPWQLPYEPDTVAAAFAGIHAGDTPTNLGKRPSASRPKAEESDDTD